MRYKYGKLHVEVPWQLRPLKSYGLALPPASEVYTGPHDESYDYGVLGNDRYGNCGFAGFVHGFEAVAILEHPVAPGIKPYSPQADIVIRAYLSFTHGVDGGVVLSQVLHTLYVAGILGQKAEGYGHLTGGLDELWAVIEAFGWSYSGFAMPSVSQDQFAAGEPFDLVGDSRDNDIEGGHCMVGCAFDQNTETCDLITWGRRQKATFRWMQTYATEHWAVLTRMTERVGKLGNFAFDALKADLNSI